MRLASGNGRRARKANSKRPAKREVFKHQVSHVLNCCERHARGLKTSFASTGMVIENPLEGMEEVKARRVWQGVTGMAELLATCRTQFSSNF